MMKVCGKCGEEKVQFAFSKNASAKDGLQRYCRACQSGYRKSLRKRVELEGRKVRRGAVDAKLSTTAVCPFCGNQVAHVLKTDPDLSGVGEVIGKLIEEAQGAIERLSVVRGAPAVPKKATEKDIEDAHFKDS